MHRHPDSDTPQELNWNLWLEEHGPLLYNYARQLYAAEAEDIMQRALIQTAKAVREGRLPARGDDALRYACTVIRHEAYGSTRRSRQRSTALQEWAVQAPLLTAPDPAAEERCAAAEAALRELDTDYAEVIMLHLWGGLTFREIAAITGETGDAVSSRYRYALILLRKKLQHS